MFYPIAIETAGTWDNMAIELVQEIGRHTSHHTGHQRNSLSVSTSVHSAAAGECVLLPQDNEHRIRSRCSRCLTFCLVFTPAALCWWAKITSCRRAAATICPAPLLPRGRRSASRGRADGNVAAVSHGQHAPTPTAAAA